MDVKKLFSFHQSLLVIMCSKYLWYDIALMQSMPDYSWKKNVGICPQSNVANILDIHFVHHLHIDL